MMVKGAVKYYVSLLIVIKIAICGSSVNPAPILNIVQAKKKEKDATVGQSSKMCIVSTEESRKGKESSKVGRGSTANLLQTSKIEIENLTHEGVFILLRRRVSRNRL